MAMLAVRVPFEVARMLSTIDVPGKKEPVDEFHVTLLYLGDDVDPKVIGEATTAAFKVTAEAKPFLITTDKVSSFETNPSGTPIICPIKSPELHTLQSSLKKAFDSANIEYSRKWPEFKPHVTLAYSDDDRPKDQSIPLISFMVTDVYLMGGRKGQDLVEVRFPLHLTTLTAALRVAARTQRNAR